jgi:hypothetical protein
MPSRRPKKQKRRKSFYQRELRNGLEHPDGKAGANEISLQPQIARLLGRLMEASANRPDDFRHVTRAAEQLARTLTTDRRLNPPKSNVAWDGLIQMITDLVPNFFEDDTGLTRSGRSVDPPVTPAKPPVIPAKAGIHDETTGPKEGP